MIDTTNRAMTLFQPLGSDYSLFEFRFVKLYSMLPMFRLLAYKQYWRSIGSSPFDFLATDAIGKKIANWQS